MTTSIEQAIEALEEAKASFDNSNKPGYNKKNWHLNASLCVDKALAALQDKQPVPNSGEGFGNTPKKQDERHKIWREDAALSTEPGPWIVNPDGTIQSPLEALLEKVKQDVKDIIIVCRVTEPAHAFIGCPATGEQKTGSGSTPAQAIQQALGEVG